MWTKLTNVVSTKTIEQTLNAARSLIDLSEDRHFVREGKNFFDTRAKLLKTIHKDVDTTLNLRKRMKDPAVNHSFLLFKSGPGPATKPHQDRPYWLKVEDKCTMFTAWIALGPIDETQGALRLNLSNEVNLEEFFSGIASEREILPHSKDQYAGGGFTTILEEQVAAKLEENMVPIKVDAGDVVLFDAFEPHSSTQNSSPSPRLAMKIVYGEKWSMKTYLIDFNKLEIGRAHV